MVEVEIYRSKVEGAHDVIVHRDQAEVEGHQTLRFSWTYGAEQKNGLSEYELVGDLAFLIPHQLRSSGKLG